MSEKSKEQQLVNLIYSIGLAAHRWGTMAPAVEAPTVADWITNQLKKAGFETTPIGLSWGVLKENDPNLNKLENAITVLQERMDRVEFRLNKNDREKQEKENIPKQETPPFKNGDIVYHNDAEDNIFYKVKSCYYDTVDKEWKIILYGYDNINFYAQDIRYKL